MKKIILILLFFSLNYISNAQNNGLYVIIDNKYQNLFKFNKELSEENYSYFSSVKVIKYNKKHKGFNKNENNLNDNDIVVVTRQPTENNYYGFQLYKKPEKMKNINHLKVYNIEDISKNIKPIREIWVDYNYSIVFIEKNNCDFNLWKMKPIHLE